MARGGHLPSWSCGRNAARTPGAGPEDVACWGAPKSLASDAPGWAAQMCRPKTSAYLSPFPYFAPLLTKVRLATGSELSPSRTLADPAQTPPWYAPHVSRELHCPGPSVCKTPLSLTGARYKHRGDPPRYQECDEPLRSLPGSCGYQSARELSRCYRF